MCFKVLRSSLDGIFGGGSDLATIDDVLREVSYHSGWPPLKDLHATDLVDDGGIEQPVECPECGERWVDVFVLAERRELSFEAINETTEK